MWVRGFASASPGVSGIVAWVASADDDLFRRERARSPSVSVTSRVFGRDEAAGTEISSAPLEA